MLHAGQDLPLGGGIALQFVRYDDPWDVLQAAQQLAEEALRSLGVAPALHEDVEHLAVLIRRRATDNVARHGCG